MGADIDAVDYSLMRCLMDVSEPLWKSELHERVLQRAHELPGITELSVQTVGRRIDSLHDNALVTSSIVKPDDLQRDLIIAYTLTGNGEITLRKKQDALLKEYLSSEEPPDNSEKLAIITLIEGVAGIEPATTKFLRNECTIEEVLLFAELSYMKDFVTAQLSSEMIQEFLSHHGETDQVLFNDR